MKTSPLGRLDIVDVIWICGVVLIIAVTLPLDLRSHDRGISVLDHILAIVAITAGGVALHYERKLDRKFERQREKIQQIVESVTTRHVGDWPKHLKQITALVKGAQPGDELLVMVDSPGYGCLSADKDFGPYLDSLRDAAKKSVTVKMLFHGEKVALDDLERQYKQEQWDLNALTSLLQPYQNLYRKWDYPSLESFVKLYEDFLTAVLFTESIFCASLTHVDEPVEVRRRPIGLPNENCFYWLVRNREMIFAYSLFEGAGSGYAFRTSDTRLMEIFASDFDSVWLNAEKLDSDAFLYPRAFDEIRLWRQKLKGGGATAGAPGG